MRRADLLLHQLHDVVRRALRLAVARMEDAPRQVDQGDVGALPAGRSHYGWLWAALSSSAEPRMLRAHMCRNVMTLCVVTAHLNSARITRGFADTVPPVRASRASVRWRMALATADAGLITAPYSSDSSSACNKLQITIRDHSRRPCNPVTCKPVTYLAGSTAARQSLAHAPSGQSAASACPFPRPSR